VSDSCIGPATVAPIQLSPVPSWRMASAWRLIPMSYSTTIFIGWFLTVRSTHGLFLYFAIIILYYLPMKEPHSGVSTGFSPSGILRTKRTLPLT